MNYEKAYNNALRRAKDCHVNKKFSELDNNAQELCEYIFPELEESEDEKIRKELIGMVKFHCADEHLGRYLNWLEKQGDYNRLVEEIKERKELISKEKEKATSTNDKLSLGGRIAILEELLAFTKEKQDEQKPTNKVEPRFKVGDWVVFNNDHGSIYQVEKIENYEYTLRHILGGSMPLSFSHGDMIRAWTIQDAKDGDVLYTTCNNKNKMIFIYHGIEFDSTCCYFLHSITNNINKTFNSVCNVKADIYPATKEQRDLLFQKMKEAGYEWDAEKKELRKIDNYCEEHCKGFQETGKCFADGECKAKREVGQNPVWSEEDENIIDELIQTISQYTVFAHRKPKEIIQWLKSLKPQSH